MFRVVQSLFLVLLVCLSMTTNALPLKEMTSTQQTNSQSLKPSEEDETFQCVYELAHQQVLAGHFEPAKILFQYRSYIENLPKTKANLQRQWEFWRDVGLTYEGLSDYNSALDSQLKALQACDASKNPAFLCRGHFQVARAYFNLGLMERAFEHLQKSSLSAILARESKYQLAGFLGKGLSYIYYGQFDDARKAATEAESFLNSLKLEESAYAEAHAYIQMGLGLVELLDSKYQKAQEHFQEALPYFRSAFRETSSVVYCEGGLAMAHWGQNNSVEATKHLQAAQEILKQRPHPRDSALLAGVEALIAQSQGDLQRAERAFQEMYNNIHLLSTQSDDVQGILNWTGLLFRFHALSAKAFLDSHRPQSAEAALRHLEQGRGLELARQNAQGTFRGFQRQDADRWRKVRLEVSRALPLIQRADQAWQQEKDTSKQAVLQQKYNQSVKNYVKAMDNLIKVRDDLNRRYPEFQRISGNSPIIYEKLTQLTTDQPDTLFLEYGLVDEHSTLLFALSRQGLKSWVIPKGVKELETKVGAWKETVQAARMAGDPNASTDGQLKAKKLMLSEPSKAQKLYQILLAPLEKAGLLQGRKRLVVVGDGPLLDLPFAALLDGKGKRVIERMTVSTAVSLSMLTWPTSKEKPSQALLCAADPRGQGEKPLDTPRLMDSAVPLPRMRDLAKEANNLFPGDAPLFGSQATESEVKRRMGQYGLLLFGTHGMLAEQNGLNSYLLLAPGQGEDGLLQAREVAGISLKARLAVLAACESGAGQKQGGEGLVGLAWAFRAAGCPSIVASQWKVQDIATQELMTHFFRQLKAGKPKDVALQTAMLAVKQRHPEPYYWAAFQVFGDCSRLPKTP